MNLKIDTKEKFTVLTPQEKEISANMSDEMMKMIDSCQTKDSPHVILNMEQVSHIDSQFLESLVAKQQEFYNNNQSFVICGLNDSITRYLDEKELLDIMNITPTESEAWDIVQMEEIERELFSDDGNEN